MKLSRSKIVQVIVPSFVLFSVWACNKDTDLMAEYVLTDINKEQLANTLVRQDYFVSVTDQPVTFDVLSNDNINNREKIKIVKISSPTKGAVVLNKDNSLTYTPGTTILDSGTVPSEETIAPEKDVPGDKDVIIVENPIAQGAETSGPIEKKTIKEPKENVVDTFDYTTETKNEDQTITTQTGTVNITEGSTGSKKEDKVEGNTGSNVGVPNIPVKGVKASSFGYDPSDATNGLKAAINSGHSTIIIDKQSEDWVVGPLYFTGLRNKTIILEEGVVLRAKKGAYRRSDRLFQLVNSNNVEIIGYGATFKMNKAEYSGEQNHALSIISSSNITVKGLTLRDAGGDGIYISRFGEGEYCSNITVEDVVSTYNQRQGMSIISVDGLVVKNSTFSNTKGKSPGSGVDFEGESIKDRFVNITFENCVFRDNFGPGILTALSKSSSGSLPLDITFKNSYLTNNFSTGNTSHPAEIDLGMSTLDRNNPIKGHITFDGLIVENSKWSAIWTKKTAEAYKVVVKNATIRNVGQGSNKPAIHIGVLSYANTATANMGGFTFENVLIDYDGINPSVQLFGPSQSKWNLKDMYGEIKVKSPHGVRFSDNMNKLETTRSPSVNFKVTKY